MLAASSGDWDRKEIDGAVHVWDVATGQRLAILREHTMGVPTVAFAPEGRTLASGSWDGTCRLWDTTTWEALNTIEETVHFGFSPDGTTLATTIAHGDRVRLRNLVTGRVMAELENGSGGLVSLTFSPDGGTLAGATLSPCAIDIWDVASGQLRNVIKGHTHWVWSVAFSPDGKRLVSGSRDGTAKVWALPAQPEHLLRGHTHKWNVDWFPISRQVLDFSPDGKSIIIPGDGNTVNVWDVNNRTKLASFNGHVQPVTSVAFSGDESLLATGSLAGVVKLWDTETKQELVTLGPDEGHVAVSDLEFSPDGTVLAATRSKDVLLVEVATGREYARLTPHTAEVSSIAFSPDGRTLATACLPKRYDVHMIAINGNVNLWDTATGKHKVRYGPWHDVSHLLSVAFSADGKTLAVGGGSGFNPLNFGSAILLDVVTGRELGHLKGHSGYVTSTIFSPDGKTLATGSNDGTVKVWDMLTRQEQISLKCEGSQIDCLKFSPDGKVLAVGAADGTVRLLRAASEEDVAQRTDEIRMRRLVTLWNNQKRWDKLLDEYSKMGEWDKAIADLSKAIELNPDDVTPWYYHALLQLYTGKVKGYRDTCAEMLDYFGQTEDARTAHWAAWTCVLGRDAVEDWSEVVSLAEQSVENDRYLATLGAALYGAGRFDESVRKLSDLTEAWSQGKELPTLTSPAYTWFFLAMAHHQLGNSDEAKSWFDKAVERSEEELRDTPAWNRRLTLQLLRKESESLIRGEEVEK